MKLEEYIKTNNLTQQQFGDLVDSTQKTISNYILGRRSPKEQMLQKIYKATGGAVTANDFLNYNESNCVSNNKRTKDIIISSNNINKIEELVMNYFQIKNKKDWTVRRITDNFNSPKIEMNDFIVIDLTKKNISKGYFLFNIEGEEEVFRVTKENGNLILINNFSKLDFNNTLIILGKIEGRVNIEKL